MKRAILFMLAMACMTGEVHAANPELPSIPRNTFNVTAYGAIGDGLRDNTTNIQNAINAVSVAGGGTVVLPAGTFLSGPITLPSRINLHLSPGAVLRMLSFGSYPGGTTNAPTFIGCKGVQDLEISGPGLIDGQGAAWWAAFRTNRELVRPMMINLVSCNRLFIHDVTFTSPPYHHCGVRKDSGNITISNLTINTDAEGPNTDGLNLAGTNVLVRDCRISAGDDNIALGATGALEDILITNCVFGSGHGVSIGSDVRHGVSNLVVANCTFNGSDFGLRLKAGNDSGGLARNLLYHDITMTNVQMPILVYSHYRTAGGPGKISRFTPEKAAALPVEPVTSTTPVWRDITFSNITAYGTVAGGVIWGRPNMPVSNVNFVSVNITAPGPFNIYYAEGVRFQDCRMNLKNGDKFTVLNANVTVTNTVLKNRSRTGEKQ